MSFFSQYPEFVEQDLRKDRPVIPVTIETLNNRHDALLPDWLIESKTVLDLGSCLGATGQWVLENGCSHYTGVEVQPELADTSNSLLSKYWTSNQYSIVQQDLRSFLDETIASDKKYDVIVMLGVIYAFLDTYTILSKVASICNYSIVIESNYTKSVPKSGAFIQIHDNQNLNSTVPNHAYQGVGARPNPDAMAIMMDTLGFNNPEGLIYPDPITDKTVHDSYTTPVNRGDKENQLPARFMQRFFKAHELAKRQVSDIVVSNCKDDLIEYQKFNNQKTVDSWVFDDEVAQRFQLEATTHIPDYNRVIEMCLDYTKQVFLSDTSISIIDVGSALGNTIDCFIRNGYSNINGVDSSQSMINSSKYPERVTLSSKFPKGNYNVVLANWTLHFVKERKQYLQDIYDSLSDEGMLIISDKMDFSIETENLYHDFKRKNGVTDEVILQKRAALFGVLVTRPLQWYIDTLKEIGFTQIQVINSRFMFNTIYARKL